MYSNFPSISSLILWSVFLKCLPSDAQAGTDENSGKKRVWKVLFNEKCNILFWGLSMFYKGNILISETQAKQNSNCSTRYLHWVSLSISIQIEWQQCCLVWFPRSLLKTNKWAKLRHLTHRPPVVSDTGRMPSAANSTQTYWSSSRKKRRSQVTFLKKLESSVRTNYTWLITIIRIIKDKTTANHGDFMLL